MWVRARSTSPLHRRFVVARHVKTRVSRAIVSNCCFETAVEIVSSCLVVEALFSQKCPSSWARSSARRGMCMRSEVPAAEILAADMMIGQTVRPRALSVEEEAASRCSHRHAMRSPDYGRPRCVHLDQGIQAIVSVPSSAEEDQGMWLLAAAESCRERIQSRKSTSAACRARGSRQERRAVLEEGRVVKVIYERTKIKAAFLLYGWGAK